MIKLRAIVTNDYEVDPHTALDHYGTEDPYEMAKVDEKHFNDYGWECFADIDDIKYKVEVVEDSDSELSQFDLQIVNTAFTVFREWVKEQKDWRASEKAVTIAHLTQIQNKIGVPDAQSEEG